MAPFPTSGQLRGNCHFATVGALAPRCPRARGDGSRGSRGGDGGRGGDGERGGEILRRISTQKLHQIAVVRSKIVGFVVFLAFLFWDVFVF